MATDYSSIIGNATAAYNNTLKGYRDQLAQQQQQQQGVIAGYNALQAGVLGGLEESSAVAGKQISDQFKRQGAEQQMQLFRQGLGNSTTRNNIQNQLNQGAAFAQNDRMAKYATIAADKRTQLGLAGLNYAGNALNSNMQLAGRGLEYGGQGAMQLGNLAQGFAGLENQQSMQAAQLKQQRDLARLYGVGGGGGGHISSYDGRPTPNAHGGGGMGSGSWISPFPNDPMVNLGGSYGGGDGYSAADISGLAGGFGGAESSGYGNDYAGGYSDAYGTAIPDSVWEA